MSGIYSDLAEYYDTLYSWKPYADEAQTLRKLLHSAGIGDGSRLIEAACGTGNYLVHLQRHFQVSGFDVSPAMLAQAQRKVPEVPLFQADMCSLRLDTPVDALLCLFSSVGYLVDEAAYARAARAFAAAVRPGGTLLVEPWIAPDQLDEQRVSALTAGDDELKICRASRIWREGHVSVTECHYLIARRDGIRHAQDSHRMAMYDHEFQRRLFDAAGFETLFMPGGLSAGRGLFIGRRRRE